MRHHFSPGRLLWLGESRQNAILDIQSLLSDRLSHRVTETRSFFRRQVVVACPSAYSLRLRSRTYPAHLGSTPSEFDPKPIETC